MNDDEVRHGSGRKRRLRACVEAWPECHEGEHDPSCCRFPKSCSCDVYDPAYVTDDDLEPKMTAAPQADASPSEVLYRDAIDLVEALRNVWVTRLYRGADEGLWDAVVDVERAFGLDAASRPEREGSDD